MIFLLSAFLATFTFADEVTLNDWTKPTKEDYLKLQGYLHDTVQERIALINLPYRRERIAGFTLINPDKPSLPTFRIERFIKDSKDAVICYSSQNSDYLYKIERLKKHLKENKFQGHFLYYQGGWPNLKEGCLKHCMVPYMFKVCALLEAKRMGYKRVLWLDTSLVPLRDLEPLFDYISKHDCVFRLNPDTRLPDDIRWDELRKIMPISDEEIAHHIRIGGCVLGLNFNSKKVCEFVDHWHEAGQQGAFYLSELPEELPMSILLNQMGFVKKGHNFNLLREIVIQELPSKRPDNFFKIHYPAEDPIKKWKRKKNK